MSTGSSQVGMCKTVEDSLREAVDSLGLCAALNMPPYPASKVCSDKGASIAPNSDIARRKGGHGCSNRIRSHCQGMNKGGICKRQQKRFPRTTNSNPISVSEEDFPKMVFHYTGQLPSPQAMNCTVSRTSWNNVTKLRSCLTPVIIPKAGNPKSPSTSTLTWDNPSLPATPITPMDNTNIPVAFRSSDPNTSSSTSAISSPRHDFSVSSAGPHGNANHRGTGHTPKSASEPCLGGFEVGMEDKSDIASYYDKVLFSEWGGISESGGISGDQFEDFSSIAAYFDDAILSEWDG